MILATYNYDCGAVITVSKDWDGFSVKDKDGLDPFCPNIGSGMRVNWNEAHDYLVDDVPTYQEIGLFYALDMTECGW